MVSLVPTAVAPGKLARIDQPVLYAGDLVIRPWTASDAADVITAFSDPAIRHWHMFCVDTEDEAREWIAARRKNWRSEIGANWAVTTAGRAAAAGHEDAGAPGAAADGAKGAEGAEGAEVIGRVGLRTLSLRCGEAEATYWVLPQARGRGVAAAALREVTRWAFEDIGLHRMALAHSTANTASCRVAEKAGFSFEGTLRSQVRHSDGWHDMHIHARINGDTG